MTQDETNPLAEKFIGTEFDKDDVPDADHIYAYFDTYGSPAFDMDEIHHLSDQAPSYPTDDVLRVELEDIDESTAKIVRAKRLDTSDPSYSGEWYGESK